MNREEAIALLKQIAENTRFAFDSICLANGKSGYEIHIKSDDVNPDALNPSFEKLGLELKEVEGILVIYRKHNRKSESPKNY